jgi:hypothetical protein
LVRKFWWPLFFFVTVLTNLDNPFTILFIKLTLFLLCTKPNPFSVYIIVDQVRYCINNLTKCKVHNILEFICCQFFNRLRFFYNIFHSVTEYYLFFT